MIAHTYRITMLRFTHLVVNVQEISNMQAIQEQLEEAEAGVYETNKNIELIQSQIHDCQRKYMIRQQKYEQAETQSQKEVQLSCMDDIKKEIDTLQAEIEKQVKMLDEVHVEATAEILRGTAQPNARLKSGNKRRITVKCWYALSLFYGQHSLDFQF